MLAMSQGIIQVRIHALSSETPHRVQSTLLLIPLFCLFHMFVQSRGVLSRVLGSFLHGDCLLSYSMVAKLKVFGIALCCSSLVGGAKGLLFFQRGILLEQREVDFPLS